MLPLNTLPAYLRELESPVLRQYPYIVVTRGGYFSVPMTEAKARAWCDAYPGDRLIHVERTRQEGGS